MSDFPIHRRGFLAGLAAAAFAASLGRSEPATEPATDHAGVPAELLQRLRRGVAITNWFRFPDRDDAEWYSTYVHDDDLKLIRDLGLTCVRLPVAPPQIYVEKDGSARADVLPHVDHAIDRLIDAGFLVILDIHGDDKRIEDDPDFGIKFNIFWRGLAERYSKRPERSLVFELLNEPVYAGRERSWHLLQRRLISTIREVSPARTIVATGASWGGIEGLLKLVPLEERNIIYSFHFYDPFPFTHQGATWVNDEGMAALRDIPYPVDPAEEDALAAAQTTPAAARHARAYAREAWTRAKLRQRIAQATAWSAEHAVPIVLGEFGAFGSRTPRASHVRWLHDMGSVLAELGIAWNLWNYDGIFGLRVDMKTLPRRHDAEAAAALGLNLINP